MRAKYYKFDSITIMPRPISNPLPIMIAAMDLNSILRCCSKRISCTIYGSVRNKRTIITKSTDAFKEGEDAKARRRKENH